MPRKNRTPLPGSESFTSLSEVWHLAPIGPAITDRYAAWCRRRARDMLARDRADMSVEQYVEERTLLQRSIVAGDYEWGPPPEMQGAGMGAGCAAIWNSDPGRLEMFRLLLEPAHGLLADDELTAVIEGGGDAVGEVFQTVFFSRFPWLRPAKAKSQEMRDESQTSPTLDMKTMP